MIITKSADDDKTVGGGQIVELLSRIRQLSPRRLV
jgi:hypothetical protein